MIPLEKQVTCRELSQKLKELGVPQDSLWYWDNIGNLYVKLHFREKGFMYRIGDDTYHDGTTVGDFYSAFTAAELGEMLPENIETDYLIYWFRIEKHQNRYACGYCLIIRESGQSGKDITYHREMSDALANAMAQMLIYLLQHNTIKVEDLK